MAGISISVQYPVDTEKPEVATVCCCDGRYIRATEQFLFVQGINNHDILALPGGPALLCMETAFIFELSVVTEALDFLVTSHKTKVLNLISHAQCGYYLKRFGSADDDRVKEDLRRAGRRMRDKYPGLRILLFFVQPKSGQKQDGFVFDQVMM